MNQITFQQVRQTSTAPIVAIGQRSMTPDGREWVYVKANEAALRGAIAVPVAITSVGTTISSSTDGANRIVYVTKVAAGWTPGIYAGATLHVNAGTGSGQVAKIRDNTNDTLVLAPEDALGTALSTDSTITIWNQYLVRNAVVTSKVQNATGGFQAAFAANDYGWVLTRGIGIVIANEVLVAGKSFVTGAAVAGEVVKGTTAKGDFDEQALGICIDPNSAVDLAASVEFHLS